VRMVFQLKRGIMYTSERILKMVFVRVLCAATFLAAVSATAQSTGAEFQQAVAAYQQSHSDADAEKVIKLAAAMEQPPPILEEAREHFVMGQTFFKEAKSPADSAQAAAEFLQAARLAPWWPEARYNTALAYEAAGDYTNAITNLKVYQLFKLHDVEVRVTQDKIYALKARQQMVSKEAVATEAKAKEAGYEVKVGNFPFIGNGKAIALGEAEGLVKTVFDAETGELLGAHMIGAEVTELIHGYVIAKSGELTEEDLGHTIFPHPTLSEMMHEAVLAADGAALHI